jgi:hypothetical protein
MFLPIPNITRIGFSTGTGVVSWLIRKVTKSVVSHTFFLYYDESFKAFMVMEAADVGFRIVGWDKFNNTNNVISIWTPSQSIESGFIGISSHLGDSYDYPGLFGNLLVKLQKALRLKPKNWLASKRTMVCSESVVRVLQSSNYPGVGTLDPETTTPQDLFEFAQKG